MICRILYRKGKNILKLRTFLKYEYNFRHDKYFIRDKLRTGFYENEKEKENIHD